MSNDPKIAQWKARGSYVNLAKAGGINIFTREIGNSSASPEKTVLLLHGFPESSFSYHLVVEGLARHFERILLFDFPGYGFSDKPKTGYSYSLLEQADVALEVWKHYGITGGHLLAHDMGDSVATELIAREVEKSLPDWFTHGFSSYTLTNGSMVLALSELRIMQKLLLTRFGKLLSKLTNKRIFTQQIKSAHGNDTLRETEISRLWEMNLKNDGRNIAYLTIKYILDRKRYETERWLPALEKTKVPIHICWGDQDNVARVEMAHHLKEKVCPNAQLTLMEDVGHFCQLGSPETWLSCILSFYEQSK